MCLVCVLWEKDKLTWKEADNALAEMVEFGDIDMMHAQETIVRILSEEEDKNEK